MLEINEQNLRIQKACQPGLEYFLPLLGKGVSYALDRLARENPTWLQWLNASDFSLDELPAETITDCGIVFQDDKLIFVQTGGRYCTQTGGHFCIQTGGDFCIQIGGDYCTQTGRHDCIQTGGHYCTQTGGNNCTQTGKDGCTQTGKDGCTQTGGHDCIQIARRGSRHKATDGTVQFTCRYFADNKPKLATVICDGTTLKHNVFYSFDVDSETWVESENQEESK